MTLFAVSLCGMLLLEGRSRAIMTYAGAEEAIMSYAATQAASLEYLQRPSLGFSGTAHLAIQKRVRTE